MKQSTFAKSDLTGTGNHWFAHEKDAFNIGLDIADLFSKLDTSSKENLSKDFASKLSTTRSMVQNYCNRYGILTSYVGLAGDTADITKYFQSWMAKL